MRKGTPFPRDPGIIGPDPRGLDGYQTPRDTPAQSDPPCCLGSLSAAQPVTIPTPHPSHLGCFVVPVEGGLVVAKIEDVTFDLRVCKGSHSKAHYSHYEA